MLPIRIATPWGGAPIDEYGHNIFECPSSSWSAVPLCAVDTAWDTANASFKNNFSILKKLVNQAAARGVHILLVNCPSNSRYGQLPYYSYFGPSQKTAHEIIEMFRLLEQQNSYFHLYDANNFGNHPYTSNEFVDDTHLCQAGAFHFSDSLNTHVHSILTR